MACHGWKLDPKSPPEPLGKPWNPWVCTVRSCYISLSLFGWIMVNMRISHYLPRSFGCKPSATFGAGADAHFQSRKTIQLRGRFCDRGVATPFWKVGIFKGQICLAVTMNGIYEDICIYQCYTTNTKMKSKWIVWNSWLVERDLLFKSIFVGSMVHVTNFPRWNSTLSFDSGSSASRGANEIHLERSSFQRIHWKWQGEINAIDR